MPKEVISVLDITPGCYINKERVITREIITRPDGTIIQVVIHFRAFGGTFIRRYAPDTVIEISSNGY